MAHPNEDLMRAGYEAFGRGDLDAVRETFAEDILWHAPGRSPMAGDYEGIDAVFEQFGKIFEMTNGTFNLEIHDVLANDEHVVVLLTARAEREGKQLDDKSVQIWHVKDGKATEQWLHSGDQYANDEFWSD